MGQLLTNFSTKPSNCPQEEKGIAETYRGFTGSSVEKQLEFTDLFSCGKCVEPPRLGGQPGTSKVPGMSKCWVSLVIPAQILAVGFSLGLLLNIYLALGMIGGIIENRVNTP